MKKVWSTFLTAALLAVVVLPLANCGDDEAASDRLSSLLKRLVDAEARGEAESFARQRGLVLEDGSVRVEIECEPGQLQAAVRAVSRVGTVEVIAEITEQLQALVPITNLTRLAREKSIHFIRKPITPVKGAGE